VSALVELREVRKEFRRRRKVFVALDDVSLDVERGEMIGYLGPNGAGKSTTVKLLTGILVATAGRVRVAGLDPHRSRRELARRVGVVFGQRTQLWWDLPLRESFAVHRHIWDVPADRHAQNLATFTDLLELGPFLDTPVRSLSLGQRMRGDLTMALLHDPELVYLDEPTVGLDVVAKAAVRHFLAEINRERGTTVLLTTHDLGDVERLCKRVVVIDQGRVAYDGSLASLVETYGRGRTLVVTLADAAPPITVAGATVAKVDGPKQWLTPATPDALASVVAAVMATHDVVDLAIEEPSVEEVITRLYGRALPPA
jgi:ABC-2 type transport system ATP-binding protein